MNRAGTVVTAWAAAVLTAGWVLAQQVPPTFRAATEAVVLDGSTPMATEDILHAQAVGAKVLEQLEPGDFAAVVHTMDKPAGQDFTQDRDLLRASVKRFNGTVISSRVPSRIVSMPTSGAGWRPGPPQDPGGVDPTLCRITLSTLSGIAKTLSALPEQRKALIFVSAGMPLDPSLIAPQGMGDNGEAGALHNDLFKELFAIIGEANRSNISVYGIDPGGLRVSPNPSDSTFSGPSPWTPAASRY
jgi:hypothetical protein